MLDDAGGLGERIMKRLLDIVGAVTGLLILALPMIVIATLVKASSPGPVFFRQVRVGRYGKLFEIVKFRTMCDRAPSLGPAITSSNDARITRLGSVLRATKLDEIPQLINVVSGDMSLVGPRPEVPIYMKIYTEEQRRIILSVRPGLTDYAAIYFRRESEILSGSMDPEWAYIHEVMPQKFLFYQKYVTSRSFLEDLRIIANTVRLVAADTIRDIWK